MSPYVYFSEMMAIVSDSSAEKEESSIGGTLFTPTCAASVTPGSSPVQPTSLPLTAATWHATRIGVQMSLGSDESQEISDRHRHSRCV
jgi:hypothetical protein